MSIFGEETIPANESPDSGHEEEAAVEDAEEHEDLDDQDLDQEDDTSPEDSGQGGELLAGKFKSQDDLAKGYLELQKKFTQTSMQAKQQQQPNQEDPAGEADLEETFWNHFQANPLATMQYLIDNVVTAKNAPAAAREQAAELGRMMDPIAKEFKQVRTEEGMNQLFERVGEIANELGNPKLAQNPSPRILRMAAQELYGDGKAALINSAREAGREEAESARRNKQAVTMNTNGKKAPQEAPKTAERQIADNIVAAGRRNSLFD